MRLAFTALPQPAAGHHFKKGLSLTNDACEKRLNFAQSSALASACTSDASSATAHFSAIQPTDDAPSPICALIWPDQQSLQKA